MNSVHVQHTPPLATFVESDGRAVIDGEIDISNASCIEDWLVDFGSMPLEVDLSGVTFFDSTALRSFLRVARRNASLRVVNPSPSVVRILDITDTGRTPFTEDEPARCIEPRVPTLFSKQ